MQRIEHLLPVYCDVFSRYLQATDEPAREQALLDAGEVGKQALADGPAHDDMVVLHQRVQGLQARKWHGDEWPALRPALQGLARGDATPLLLALLLPHELAQRAHHERRWQREHETLAAMFQQTEQFIVVLDADGLIEDVNPAFVRATGWSPMEAALATSEVWTLPPLVTASQPQRCQQPRRDGSAFTAEWSVSVIRGRRGQPIGHVCIGSDVTRAQQVEESLRENDKLRAVSTLAGGIAHDFNNLLGSILGLAELCLLDAPTGSRQARNLERIGQAGERAAALVRQLLDFSRRTPAALETLPAAAWFEQAEPLLRAAVLGRATLHCDVQPGIGDDHALRIDHVQMEQALLNLVRNAADAVPASGGGVVRVALQLAELPDQMCLQVSDNGSGMTPEVLAKVFEPFFTTKPVGQGTGLGLAAVHGIVASHGGRIEARSEPGKGSCFRLLLPLLPLSPAQVGARLADNISGARFPVTAGATPASPQGQQR